MGSRSIRVKFFIAFTALFAVTIVLGVFSILSIRNINLVSRESREIWLPAIQALGDLNNVTSDVRAAEGAHIIAKSQRDMADIELEIQGLLGSVDDAYLALETYIKRPRSTELANAFGRQWADYLKALQVTLEASRADRNEEAIRNYTGTSKRIFDDVSETLRQLVNRSVQNAAAASDRANETYLHVLIAICLAILSSGILVILVTIMLSRWISEPIVDMTAAMRDIAGNRLDVLIPGLDRADEIGSMARSVEVFRRNAAALIDNQARLAAQAVALSKALAAEKQIATMKHNFVSMASHEFRTPLTIIDGQAQRLIRLREKLQPGEIGERATKIRSAVQRMTGLIESILSSASFAEGRLSFNPVALDPAQIVTEACDRQREVSPGRQVDVDVTRLPPTLFGDPLLLGQMVGNLVGNAIKYSAADSVVLVTGWTENDEAIIAVGDHGIGIPEADQQRLFDQYFRGSNVGAIPGTGVGLSLVQSLAELHNGSVALTSAEGVGSVFTIRLPIAAPPPAALPVQETEDAQAVEATP